MNLAPGVCFCSCGWYFTVVLLFFCTVVVVRDLLVGVSETVVVKAYVAMGSFN